MSSSRNFLAPATYALADAWTLQWPTSSTTRAAGASVPGELAVESVCTRRLSMRTLSSGRVSRPPTRLGRQLRTSAEAMVGPFRRRCHQPRPPSSEHQLAIHGRCPKPSCSCHRAAGVRHRSSGITRLLVPLLRSDTCHRHGNDCWCLGLANIEIQFSAFHHSRHHGATASSAALPNTRSLLLPSRSTRWAGSSIRKTFLACESKGRPEM